MLWEIVFLLLEVGNNYVYTVCSSVGVLKLELGLTDAIQILAEAVAFSAGMATVRLGKRSRFFSYRHKYIETIDL